MGLNEGNVKGILIKCLQYKVSFETEDVLIMNTENAWLLIEIEYTILFYFIPFKSHTKSIKERIYQEKRGQYVCLDLLLPEILTETDEEVGREHSKNVNWQLHALLNWEF